jgi:1-acyl-sn-glycerol-3-phosphate acyltransferase
MHSSKNHRWRRRIFRYGLWNVTYRFWFQMHVHGLENVPPDGPTIMMVNHISVVDPAIMISFAPSGRDIVPLAKMEAFSQPLIRYFVSHWGAIPVARGSTDTKALKSALQHIRDGDIVLLFAEGTRNREGMQQGEEGSVYLALKTNATVVPVALWGTRGFPFSLWRDFRTTPIHVCFGKPFRFRSDGASRLPREQFRAMTDEAMYRIAAMLPPEWRGVYSDLSLATTEHLEIVDLESEGLTA